MDGFRLVAKQDLWRSESGKARYARKAAQHREDFHRESQYFVSLLRRLGYRARLHYVPDFNSYFTALARTPTAQAGFVGWFDVPLAVDMLDVSADVDLHSRSRGTYEKVSSIA